MSCKYLYFTEKDLQQRWNEVKSEEEFWSQLSFRMKKMTKITLESILEEEMKVSLSKEAVLLGTFEESCGQDEECSQLCTEEVPLGVCRSSSSDIQSFK